MGNLPTNVSVNRVKAHFGNAARIDIGFAQRMKYTRYAFVRYNTVEEAFVGFHLAFDMDLGPRSLVIRFRRKRGNIGLNTNDPDGRKSNKRKRLSPQDDEDFPDVDEPEFDMEHSLNPFGIDCMTTPSLSSPSQSVDTFMDDHNCDSVEVESDAGVVLPIRVKEEPPSDDNAVATSSATSDNNMAVPDELIATRIKQEDDDDFSDDDYFDGNLE